MFPHQKLDWNLSRLEKRVETSPDDGAPRAELAAACIAKGMFHDGGEPWLNKALTHARRALQGDPDHVPCLVIAGLALTGMDRLDAAEKHLDRALSLAGDRGDVHLALGLLWAAKGLRDGTAIREMELACRLSPNAWEPHHLLSRQLWNHVERGQGSPRLVERAQFHAVRALRLGASPAIEPALWFQLAQTCLHNGRHAGASRLLIRLAENEKYKARALWLLGLVDVAEGRFKNAVQHFRQHIGLAGESPKALTRIAMCYLELDEVARAREAAQRGLALDPGDTAARFALASALVMEGREDDAVRELKALLSEAPDHSGAFAELVRLRNRSRDVRWLRSALRAEVTPYDRLPAHLDVEGRRADPRGATRERVAILLRALADVDEEATTAIALSMELTTDEGLRFQLWEAAIEHAAGRRARAAVGALQDPGSHYAIGLGREVLALAHRIPESALQRGLHLADADLGKAAVDRHGPSRDVRAYRTAVDAERRTARAWQALILLAVGASRQDKARPLLMRWTTEADPDLADAARTALALLGDEESIAGLRRRARARGAEHLVDALATAVATTAPVQRPRAIRDDADRLCATCGRRGPDVDHLIASADAAVCDRCLAQLAIERRDLASDEPDLACRLCTQTAVDARAVWTFRGVPICAECLDASLGLLEREAIDAFLADG